MRSEHVGGDSAVDAGKERLHEYEGEHAADVDQFNCRRSPRGSGPASEVIALH